MRGDVDDDVVAFNGRAIVESGATVGGDVLSQDRPAVAEGASVDGDVRRVNFSNWFRLLGWVLWLGWWLAVTVSLFVFGVLLLALVPRIFPPILEVARTRVGPVILWGLIAAIGLPIARRDRDGDARGDTARADRIAVARAALQPWIRHRIVDAGTPAARRAAERVLGLLRRSHHLACRRPHPRRWRPRHDGGDRLRRRRGASIAAWSTGRGQRTHEPHPSAAV